MSRMNTQERSTARNNHRRKTAPKGASLSHGWRIWDVLLLSAILGGIVGLGIWAESPWFVILGAALNVTGGFFNVKTSKLYFVFTFGYSLCYLNASYNNHLYGEIATTLFLMVLAVVTIVKWLRADDIKRSTYEMKALEPITLIPIAIFGVAAFLTYGFVLRHVGSRLPFLSAGTAVVSVCAFVLASKRVKLQWVLWLVNNAIFITIWVVTIVESLEAGNSDYLESLPLIAQSAVYVFINVYGLINWNREWKRRSQTHEPEDLV